MTVSQSAFVIVMLLHLDFKSGVPVYLQLVQQVQAAVAAGRLRPGDGLPSVRALAEELRINRNTAAKAYAELETLGVLEARPGSGYFVRETATSPLRRAVRSERLAELLDALIVQAHHLQIDDVRLRDLLEERLHIFHERRAEQATH